MDKEDFKMLMYALYGNKQLIIPDGQILKEWIDNAFVESYYKKQLTLNDVVDTLPTKDEVITEGEKQIVDWLEGNTDREKEHYRVGFRRSFEYVLRRLK